MRGDPGNEISVLREAPESPHPRHLQTWQEDASRGPGRELSLNPPLQYLELPASRAVGSQVLPPVGPQPHESAGCLVPGRAQRARTLHRPGSRAGAGARDTGDGLGSVCQRQQPPAGHQDMSPQRQHWARPWEHDGPALRRGGGVPILLRHLMSRAAGNTSPSPRICPRGCIAQTSSSR